MKLGFVSLPYWFLTENSQYQSWKANLFPALAGNDLRPLELNYDMQPIRPLNLNHEQYLKKLYT